ncbi:MAG TPA: FAD-dependent monooxygenase, partial [Candidatus Binatia bacterium]|nr:FAD-dependent monooxygenase [Candidatus Binatia bacterium]
MALRAIVVGGGIGGLTTAIALARKGISVTALEQAGELGEIGAGIQLSPNATRVLFAFGLERALGEVAFRPEAVEARSWRRGVRISRVPLGAAVVAQFGAPYLHVHRADLIALLARAAAEHALVELRLRTACTGCVSDEHGATLTLATGESITADLVVGADGIHSTVRTALFGAEQARFTGNVAWRGLV